MPFGEILVLAVALAMDATAVAGARGLAARTIRLRDPLLVALLFGGAQALMPALGGVAGAAIAVRISGWGQWLAFAVLTVLGLKMIREAREVPSTAEEQRDPGHPFGLQVLVVLAVATSIDALAAGVTLAVRGAPIVRACATIGIVTAALSFAGVYLGHRFGAGLGKRLDVLGGVVLIGLGIKALF